MDEIEEGYRALAAAQDDEDRQFAAAVRDRRAGGKPVPIYGRSVYEDGTPLVTWECPRCAQTGAGTGLSIADKGFGLHWKSNECTRRLRERAVLTNEHVSEAIRKTFDGTAETIKVDWRS